MLAATGYQSDNETLNQYTVFAPNDDAFVEAGVDVDQLIAENDSARLAELLSDYVAEGRREMSELTDPVAMISGNAFALTIDGAAVSVGGAPVVSPPLEAINGIVHQLASLYTG